MKGVSGDKALEQDSKREGRCPDHRLGEDAGQRLKPIVDAVVASSGGSIIRGEEDAPFPSPREIARIVANLIDLVLPVSAGNHKVLAGYSVERDVAEKVAWIYDRLSLQISMSIRHGCMANGQPCAECAERGQDLAIVLLEQIPRLRKVLLDDVRAAFDRDPAARSLEDIVLSYPGLMAITAYRLAHELWLLEVPFIPRMMTEYAHGMTGVDIHPAAKIGSSFFIDHGTGVVIGETTEIGDNVTIYQGVTLGGYRFRRGPDGSLERGNKRHPTVGDSVTIYAGATILGGETVIGTGSVVGGSVWLTHSVPSDGVVTIKEPDLKYKVGY
jgi:serine O-acetyltransferase